MAIDTQSGRAAESRPPDDIFTSASYDPGRTLHLVLFKYKPEVTSEQKMEVAQRFFALQQSRRKDNGQPYILFIYGGVQNSLIGKDFGFEQGYTLGFKSGGDRNYYEGDPIVTDPSFFDEYHAEFKAFVGPLLLEDGGVIVLDYKDGS